jgi:hypothetical protein
MTAWDLLSLALQRWIVTLCGVVATAVVVIWAASAPSVYFGQVRVVLLPPVSAQHNVYLDLPTSLTNLAGVVALDLRGSVVRADVVSANVTMVGEGYRSGYEVRHPNAGGQWVYRFDEPVLDVQAVGATPREAQQYIALALSEIESSLTSLQDGYGVPAESRVRTSLNPSTPQLSEQSGSRVRAVAASAVTGGMVTLFVLTILGRKRGLHAIGVG